MTDNDIVKALKCCTGKDGRCEDCPYEECFTDDKNFLLEDALDLINRQKAEIERLREIISVTDKTLKKCTKRPILKERKTSMIKIELSKSQVENLMEFFEFRFIDLIRSDIEIDNIEYVVDMCEIYMKLKAAREEMFGDG